MKRTLKLAVLFIILVSAVMYGCSSGEYKRINIVGELLGEGEEKRVDRKTKVENNATEVFQETMPIYKCIPRVISVEDIKKLAAEFDVSGEPELRKNGKTVIHQYQDIQKNTGNRHVSLSGNEISCYFYSVAPVGYYYWDDDKLESEARKVFQRIELLTGEYEYLGISSERIVHTSHGEEIESVRVSFRRLLDGTRVIGNDICDFYFDHDGLTNIELKLYDYEIDGEFDMVPLKDAFDMVKNPDAFSITKNEDCNYTGVADKMIIERVKLLLVNQYTNGCEILQPVYNIIGTLENETGSVEFSSKVIAIPEKYTY